jgi:hypothetical protein
MRRAWRMGLSAWKGVKEVKSVRKEWTDVVVEIALAEDEFSETPFYGKDVGKDSGDGGCDLDTREVESAGMGIGCVLGVH